MALLDIDEFSTINDLLVKKLRSPKDISGKSFHGRMKRNLISVVAHELKTPVTTLRLQSETLQRQIRSGKLSDSQQLLTEMLEESERLQKSDLRLAGCFQT